MKSPPTQVATGDQPAAVAAGNQAPEVAAGNQPAAVAAGNLPAVGDPGAVGDALAQQLARQIPNNFEITGTYLPHLHRHIPLNLRLFRLGLRCQANKMLILDGYAQGRYNFRQRR